MFNSLKNIFRDAYQGAREIKTLSTNHIREVKLGLAKGGVIKLTEEEENLIIEELINQELQQPQQQQQTPSIFLLNSPKSDNKPLKQLTNKDTLYHLKRLKKESLEYILGYSKNKLIIQDLDKEPHLIITGKTGSGKTVTLFNILVSLIHSNTPSTLKISLIDPKILSFGDNRILNSSFLLEEPSIGDTQRALEILKSAYHDMMNRYQMMRAKGVKDYRKINLYAHVIFIDEIYELLTDNRAKEILKYITKIASLGRQSGVYLVLATQSIRAEILSGSLKANIKPIAHQVENATESNIIGIKNCHHLRGAGEGFKRLNNSNELVKFQATFLDIEEDSTYQFFRPKTPKTQTQDTQDTQDIDPRHPIHPKKWAFDNPRHPRQLDTQDTQNRVNLGLNHTQDTQDKEMIRKILLSANNGKIAGKKDIINVNSRVELKAYERAIKQLTKEEIIYYVNGKGYFLKT